MRVLILAILVVGLLYSYFFIIPCISLARISFKITDEQGHPIEGAHVKTASKLGKKSGNEGTTDKNGYYSICSRTTSGTVYIGVQKDNFYGSGMWRQFYTMNFGIWQPWNEQITIVLRPIVNPVPMYVRNLNWFAVPVIGRPVGYDLMQADWVRPYGKGEIADFIFKVDKRFKNRDDYKANLSIRFSNPHDGILIIKEKELELYKPKSRFRLPRIAPEDGYQPEFSKLIRPGLGDDRYGDNNYTFRVRSVTDNNGKLIRAMYGKIRNDIEFEPRTEIVKIKMHYYLNPDYTHNLEFDPKKNLFTNLPETEGVGLP